MSMGDRIRGKRIEKELTMEQLADKLGVGKSAVNKWEKGHVQNIKRSTIEKLCQILDCSPAYLFGWEEPEATWDGPSDLPAFTIGELQLLEIYKQLSEEKQADMIKFGQFLLSRQAEERKKTTELSKEA